MKDSKDYVGTPAWCHRFDEYSGNSKDGNLQCKQRGLKPCPFIQILPTTAICTKAAKVLSQFSRSETLQTPWEPR